MIVPRLFMIVIFGCCFRDRRAIINWTNESAALHLFCVGGLCGFCGLNLAYCWLKVAMLSNPVCL